MTTTPFAAALALALQTVAQASATAPPAAHDHGAYSLFNPVPAAELRDLGTDRPDTTETFQSVDAGHLQVEMDVGVVSFERSLPRDAPVSLSGPGINLKVGLTQATDLQLVLPAPGLDVLDGEASGTTGTFAARLKWNIAGNDGGFFGLALMPYVELDLPADASVVGVAVPYGFNLADDMWLVSMVQLDAVRTKAAWSPEALVTCSFGRELVGPLAAYIETFVTVTPTQLESTSWTGSGGVTIAVHPDMQLDAGARVDILAATPRVDLFTGFTIRR